MTRKALDEPKVDLALTDNRIIRIFNRYEIFKFDLETGKFSILCKKRPGISIKNAYSCAVLSNGKKIQTIDAWTERKWDRTLIGKDKTQQIRIVVSHQGPSDKKLGDTSLVFSAELFAANPAVLLTLEMKNESFKPITVKEFQPLVVDGIEGGSFALGSDTRHWRFFKHGYQTSTPCYSLSLTELDKTCSVDHFRNNYNPRTRLNPVKGEFDSDWVTAFRDGASGNSAVMGFVTMKNNMCQVDFRKGTAPNHLSSLSLRSLSDDITCDHGGSLKSEKAMIDLGDPVSEALDLYGDFVASEMDSVPWKRILTGWCSWYEFFEEISEQLVMDVIEFYKKNRKKYPIDYIQVDDGYFIHRGDWTTTNELFPHGMKYIADKIKSAGFKPGIWLSPFQISGGSRLFQEHPEWTIKDRNGKPIGEGFDVSMKYSYYSLDCTNPEVIDWLKSLFRTITKEWGYEYLKIDFLYAAAIDGVRYDKNTTRGQALRKGLEAIRETVGTEIPILGCLAPIGQAVGIVNSYRVSPDTATRWKSPWPFDCGPALRDTMRNTILRYFMHNKFWSNDPDCVIARRGKERSEYPKSAEIDYLAKGGTINEDEVRFEFTVLGILGGPLIYSDDPIHLPPEREKFLPLLLPPYQGKARIVDLLEEALPKFLNLKIDKGYDKWDLVGLLNWDDSPADTEIRFTRIGLKQNVYYHVFSFWDERYLGKARDKLAIRNMAAHSASLLSIREALPRPQVISSTIHITQGAAEIERSTWNEKTRTLDIALSPSRGRGRLYIYAPPPFRFISVTPTYLKSSQQKVDAGGALVIVELDDWQCTSLEVRFR